ncbi:MAG: 50S ribosomal protein L29 [Anaerolineae bacterium]|nr:50S ribosomal protein L29 [Anaerolineae bacterium]MCB9132785.1 50S ribosomal protein L29 [Anaerolineales bacterium]HPR07839.1 50S ribosomal protein L29 [Denitromonas sp.]MCB0227601.1 50S ribosomal protein L29 [Anaerolineae bacterium]MCB0232745.1 50S ribosomal protein L29 [Anaerolineae bacterium]
MRPDEIRNYTSPEIGQRLDEAYEELFNLRFQRTTGQMKNTARMGEVRRDIARMKTVLRERELAAWLATEEN